MCTKSASCLGSVKSVFYVELQVVHYLGVALVFEVNGMTVGILELSFI